MRLATSSVRDRSPIDSLAEQAATLLRRGQDVPGQRADHACQAEFLGQLLECGDAVGQLQFVVCSEAQPRSREPGSQAGAALEVNAEKDTSAATQPATVAGVVSDRTGDVPRAASASAEMSIVAMQIARLEVSVRSGNVGGDSLTLAWNRPRQRSESGRHGGSGDRTVLVVRCGRPGEVSISIRGGTEIDLSGLASELERIGLCVVHS